MKRANRKKYKSSVIVVPTYNEEENIGKLVVQIFKVLPRTRVLVVDDSPNNKTVNEVKKLSRSYSGLSFIKRKKKGGRGSAVLDGFRSARENFNPDIYIEMDADLSHEPEELPRIVKLTRGKTVVLASRYVKGSKLVNCETKRKITSRISNLLVRLILGLPMNDNTNGYRSYPKSAVKHLISEKYISGGYIVLSETAYVLKKKGYSFVEVPSVFVNRQKGKSNTSLSEFYNAFITLVKLRFRKQRKAN